MRADAAAFRELDAIVRKLTEQLAGYRRRALSSEARTRDLEQDVTALQATIAEAVQEAARATEARDHALAAAREATAASKAAQAALTELEHASTGPTTTQPPAAGPDGAVSADRPEASGELAAENARLRARLTDARDRTAQLADRVRFLRQQLMQGADR